MVIQSDNFSTYERWTLNPISFLFFFNVYSCINMILLYYQSFFHISYKMFLVNLSCVLSPIYTILQPQQGRMSKNIGTNCMDISRNKKKCVSEIVNETLRKQKNTLYGPISAV